MILDGYGLNDKHEGNAIYEAKTPCSWSSGRTDG